MLATDAKRLRWLGIDMHARWRRRVAVVLTYVAYAVVVWVHPERTFNVLYLLYLAGLGQLMASAIAEGMHVWSKRAVLGVLIVGLVWLSWKHPQPLNRMANDLWAFLLIIGWSVLGWGKLVESVWGRGWFARRLAGRSKRLDTLDDFARHYFGESFGELTEEQQMEVGRLDRTSPMGEWVKPGSGRFPTMDDERLKHEDDRLRAQVQRVMNWVLFLSAVVWSVAAMAHDSISAGTIEAWAWTLATLAVTLRPAIVLWMEQDATVMNGEVELVGREA